MQTFVMGDIHGNYQALVQCLKKSKFNKKKDRLIQLGDVVDRGPDTPGCIEELLTIKHLVAIRGNHDEWLREFIETDYHPSGWSDGGKATVQSYLELQRKAKFIKKTANGYKTGLEASDIPKTHQEFLRKQVNYFIDENNNCYLHAGFDRHNTFFNQRPELYFYDRDLWNDAVNHLAAEKLGHEPGEFIIKTEFNNIFLGHTPTLRWKTDRPMKIKNIYNLDTGAGLGGRLTIMNVETKEWHQSDPLIVKHLC